MANLLDLFAIGFKSDGIQDFEKELKKTESELDTAEKKVKTLEKQLQELEKSGQKDSDEFKRLTAQLKIAEDEVEKFGNEIKVMQGKSDYQLLKLEQNFKSIVKQLGLLASVGIAVRQSMQFYEQAEQLDFLAQKTNIAVDSLQRLGNAAKRYGGTTEGTASTVEQFTSKEFKEKALKVGISVSKDNPEQTLENIAAKMEKLKTDAEKWQLAKDLGIDEGTTRLLIEGVQRYREELKRADKYKLYTKDDIERMRDYRQIQNDIKNGIQNIQIIIARLLLPAITTVSKIIRNVTDFLSKHEGIVKIAGVLIGVAAAIGIVKFAVIGLNNALKFVLANPVVLTILGWSAVIAGLIAIIQDLYTFIKGGDSLIGRLWERWGYDLENIRQGFEIWGERIKRWWNNFLSIFNKDIEWQDAVKDIDVLKPVPPEYREMAEKMAAKNIKDAEKDYRNSIKKGQDTLNVYNNNNLNAIPTGSVQAATQTQAITQNSTKNVNVNIGTIQTQATDGKQLATDFSDTIKNIDNGIAVQ
jgi:hypothetical protein